MCSKPVQLTNRDEYLITAVKHRKSFNIPGLSPFFWSVSFFGLSLFEDDVCQHSFAVWLCTLEACFDKIAVNLVIYYKFVQVFE